MTPLLTDLDQYLQDNLAEVCPEDVESYVDDEIEGFVILSQIMREDYGDSL